MMSVRGLELSVRCQVSNFLKCSQRIDLQGVDALFDDGDVFYHVHHDAISFQLTGLILQ